MIGFVTWPPFSYLNVPNDKLLYVIQGVENSVKYAFSQRIINDWNNLPRDIIEPDVASFKSKLDVYWQNS